MAGAHVNFLPTTPSGDSAELDQFTESDLARLQRASQYIQDQSGYMKLQSTRPQTLAYALTDSPVGQLARIIEKFKEWTDSDKVPEDAVARDRLLTNATIYWLTGTAGSSAQLYYEAVGFLPTAPAPPSLLSFVSTNLSHRQAAVPAAARFQWQGFAGLRVLVCRWI